VHALARWGETGVDRTMTATLEFASGLLAQIACSFATSRHRGAFIGGELASIETTFANDTSADEPGRLLLKRQSGRDTLRETIETAAAGGFLAEAESFHDLVRFGWRHWTGATPDESVDIALTLDAIAASARSGVPVDVAA
jgi:predicted dehydrogenase